MKMSRISKVIITECVIIMLAFISLFLPKRTINIPIENPLSANINMPFGRFWCEVEYSIDNDCAMIILDDIKANNTNWQYVEVLPKTENTYSFEVWNYSINKNIKIHTNADNYTANDQITSIRFRETNHARMCFLLFAIFVLAVTLYVHAVVIKKIKKETVYISLCILAITLVATLPLFTPYVQIGYDGLFHIVRMEGMKEGYMAGQFPVRVEPIHMGGAGYAISTFYGGFFFNIPVLARFLGFSLQNAFKILIFCMTLMSAITSYYLGREVSGKKSIGVIASAFYTLSSYRYIDVYIRSAVGEITATAVLPLIALGLYNIFTKPYDDKYKRRFILPVIGYTLLIESHLISTFMTGLFTIIICILLCFKTFKKQTFIVLFKTFIYSVIMNLVFIVPLLDDLIHFPMVVNSNSTFEVYLQDATIAKQHFFYLFLPQRSYVTNWGELYHISYGFPTVIAILLAGLAVLTCILKKKKCFNLLFVSVLAAFTMFITTRAFPWNEMVTNMWAKGEGTFSSFARMLSNVQFAYRYAEIGMVLLTIMLSISLGMLLEEKELIVTKLDKNRVNTTRIMQWATVGLLVIQVMLYNVDIIRALNYEKPILNYIYAEHNDYYYIMGNYEYLPMISADHEMLPEIMMFKSCITNNADVLEYNQHYTNAKLTVRNDTNKVGEVQVPMTYYPGYKAKDYVTGEKIEVSLGDTGRMKLTIPPNSECHISLKYADKPLWVVATIISYAFAVGFIYVNFFFRRKKEK